MFRKPNMAIKKNMPLDLQPLASGDLGQELLTTRPVVLSMRAVTSKSADTKTERPHSSPLRSVASSQRRPCSQVARAIAVAASVALFVSSVAIALTHSRPTRRLTDMLRDGKGPATSAATTTAEETDRDRGIGLLIDAADASGSASVARSYQQDQQRQQQQQQAQHQDRVSSSSSSASSACRHPHHTESAGSTSSTTGSSSSCGSGTQDVEGVGPEVIKVQQQQRPVPFFAQGKDTADSRREMASHLDYLLEEYRKDLVKVVQGVDMIINGLEEQVASGDKKRSRESRDMPSNGVKRLAAKLRRKLDKTPPRWQVNIDVLSWLLRPVPFVAGLPMPTRPTQASGSACPPSTPPAPAPPPTPTGSSVFAPPPQSAAVSPAVAAAAAGAAAAAEERRAVPVPVAPFRHGPPAETLAQALGALGMRKGVGDAGGPSAAEDEDSGRERTSKRARFHAYDETHQIFTHILRDWTSEGDSVRAAVYDPILKALDLLFGKWQPYGTGGSAARGAGAGTGDVCAWKDYRDNSPRAKKARHMVNVLVPGAGLGRLAAEVAARGYASVHANELSPTMLASSYWLMEALRADKLPAGCRSGVEPTPFPSASAPAPVSPAAAYSAPAAAACSAFASRSANGNQQQWRPEAGSSSGGGGAVGSEASDERLQWRRQEVPMADRMRERSSSSNGDVFEEEKAADDDGRRRRRRRLGFGGSNDAMDQDGSDFFSSPSPAGAWPEGRVPGAGEGNRMQCQQGGGDDAAGASLDGAGLRGGGDRGGDSVGIESDGGGSERASAGGKGGREDSGETEDRREFCEFYPFLNDAPHNEMDGEARFRPVLFPDTAGRTVLARASGRLSFQSGEFTETYGAIGGPFEGAFDAIITSFFVDTAPNVVEYVATIRRTLKPGGVWINCGPLHWHKQSALTLSLDEMLALVVGSGFRLEAMKRLPPCGYRVTDRARSLRVDEFKPVFWVAVLEGSSAP